MPNASKYNVIFLLSYGCRIFYFVTSCLNVNFELKKCGRCTKIAYQDHSITLNVDGKREDS